MRRTSLALLLGCAFATPAFAQPHSLSLTTTLASNYIADGVSTSDNGPALQIGLDYEHESGFYAGVWGSNVDSDEHGTPNLELDYTIGFKHSLVSGLLDGDVGITHYSWYHPDGDSDEWNYQEWFAGLTLLENTSLYYYYADDSKVWDGTQRRIILEHNQPLPSDFTLILTAEHVGLESAIGDDYEAYRVGLARSWLDTDFTLSYWKNTIDHGDSTTKDHVVLEVSKKFDFL